MGRALDGGSVLSRAGRVEGEGEGPHRNGILAEAGERDLRDRVERVHHIPWETGGDGVPQWRPDQGEATAHHDDLRVEEVDGMGQGEGEVVGQFAEDGLCDRVVLGQGRRKEPGLALSRLAHKSRKWTSRVEGHGLTDALIHGPPRAAVLHNCAGLVQSQVSEFRFTRYGAMIDVPTDDEPTSDAATHVDPEDRIVFSASPVTGFTKGGHVRVIVDRDRQTSQVREPLAELELVPSLNLMGTGDPSGPMIHRAAEAHANGYGIVGLDEGREVVGQFGTNALPTRGPIHLESAPFEETSVRCSSDQLKFGAPDLDSERGHTRRGWLGPVGRVDRVLAAVALGSLGWEDRRGDYGPTLRLEGGAGLSASLGLIRTTKARAL